MIRTVESIRETISRAIPEGSVIPEHNERGHFYGHVCRPTCGKLAKPGKITFPSVTGKLQILKDESLINYKMNQAIQYFFRNFERITQNNLLEHLNLASRASQDVLEDAGDIGTEIHQYRENFFNDWIRTGVRPADILSYIPEHQVDLRARSALRALDKFLNDTGYRPVWSELLVDSHKLGVSGTLDDLGLMNRVMRPGNPECVHEIITGERFGHCCKCDYKHKIEFVLMDVKTSNRFKDHYFFQVALYCWMLRELTGLKPDRCFILKLDKMNGTYQIEDLKRPAMLASYARSMIRTNNGIEFIKSLRKDNQKKVAPPVQF